MPLSSSKKKVLFGLILATFTYLMVEGLALVANLVLFQNYSLYQIQTRKISVVEAQTTAGVYAGDEYAGKDLYVKPIIHPYIGFHVDGKRRKEGCVSDNPQDCFTRIKVASDKPFPKRSNDKLIVAILGGSFADGIGRSGEGMIKRTLSASERYSGREVILFNFAGGAYKQPQQLMNLAYHYAIGAEFDLVINIDGFNELSGSYYNYRGAGVHYSFPKSWNHRVAQTFSKDYLDLYTEKRQLQQAHVNRAEFMLLEGFRYSPLLNFIWRLVDRNTMAKLAALEEKIDASGKVDNRDFAYEALGPDYTFTDWAQFYDDVGNMWVSTSLSLRGLAEGRGAHYFHFLQPNQYIEGNKILSDWERENAVLAAGGYGNVYKQNHHVLVAKSQQLLEQNVKYQDLTFMLKDNADTLYVDNCCHMNSKGYDLVAKGIIERSMQMLDQQQ